jgi:hypothetical protein
VVRRISRVVWLVAPFVVAAAALVIGGQLIRQIRDDAFVRCAVANAKPNTLILQRDGSYRSTTPSISLRWSWKRRDYLCVYHDEKGNETVRPAPASDE